MAAENNLWQSTRPRLLQAGFFVQRIETSTGEGVPDVWVGWDGGYAWLENKAVREWPKRGATPVFGAKGLRPEQITWHIGARQRGVVAFIWVGVGVGASRQTFLIPGTLAERFNNMNCQDLEAWAVKLADLPLFLIKQEQFLKVG